MSFSFRHHSRALVAVLSLAAVTACDQALAPSRTVATRPLPRLGDYAFDFDSVRIPDSVNAGDSIPVRYWVAAGQDPCAYSTHLWQQSAGLVMVTVYGVSRAPTPCRPSVIKLPPFRSAVFSAMGADTADELHVRVVVCQGSGAPMESMVTVALPIPTRTPTKTMTDPNLTDAARFCRVSATFVASVHER